MSHPFFFVVPKEQPLRVNDFLFGPNIMPKAEIPPPSAFVCSVFLVSPRAIELPDSRSANDSQYSAQKTTVEAGEFSH
jgi:hypothetical protein